MQTHPVALARIRELYPSLAVSGYQRAVVWGLSQRASLIRSLLEDYPTGLVVLNRLSVPRRVKSDAASGAFLPRVEIIDGQQRLTTVFDFLRDPLVYFTEWAPRAPSAAEPKEIQAVRENLDALFKELRKARSNFAPRKANRRYVNDKIRDLTTRELARREEGKKVEDPRFHQLVESIVRLRSKVGHCSVVVQELKGLDSPDAERIYDVINSSGTRLKWWELLWGREAFVHTEYRSNGPYRTRWNDHVERVAQFYRLKNVPRDSPIRAVPPETISLWHAMHALGHYVYCKFAQRDPRIHPNATEGASSKPKVDGLGFRLVSTFLSHDVGRAAVYELLDRYPVDNVRQAIDALFDAADVLFDPKTAGDFQFFVKYAAYFSDPLPAYPLVGLFVAGAKYVARSAAEGGGNRMSTKDATALRALTEDLFRDAICTSNWAGTGDARLKQWLDTHFESVSTSDGNGGAVFPGAIRPAEEPPKSKLWLEYIEQLTGSGRRLPDRRAASFLFWTQYILDRGGIGALPKGQAQFDHIVPFNRNYPQTGHPLNIAAISADLNRSKGNLTYAGWEPDGDEDRRYRTQVLCQPNFDSLPASANVDFLAHASFTDLSEMLAERKRVFEFALTSAMRDWISQGDSK